MVAVADCMAVPTNVEGDGAADIVATMSERTQKVLLYFATVTFGLAAPTALKGADIALEDVMDAFVLDKGGACASRGARLKSAK